MHYPEHLLRLIDTLKKLPGVGSKSAERFAFQIIDWPEEKLEEMAEIIGSVKKKLHFCSTCGALTDSQECTLCDLSKRSSTQLCVVGNSRDVFLIEHTQSYNGLYHVLGGLLSPLNHAFSIQNVLDKIKQRILISGVQEVILALDSTLEGDATALYFKRELETLSLRITRLALGMPMGSPLDYVDGGTLARALAGRSEY